MPKLLFNSDKTNNNNNNNKCATCIHSHKIISGDKIYFECFPVKDYADRKVAIDNCKGFYDTNIKIRDIYIAIAVYIVYPQFEHKITEIGGVFREFDGTDDDLWKELKQTNFYDKIKEALPTIGYSNKTLFEPIIFAEREITSKKWKVISTLVKKEIAEEIINNLENNKNNNS